MTFHSLLPYGLAGGLLLLLGWLVWRFPTVVMMAGLLSLAVRPQLFYGGPEVGYEWGLHQTLLLLGLIGNALSYGVRRWINWPILALVVSCVLGVLFGDAHAKLSTPFMLMTLGVLIMPWCFTQVVLEAGSRRLWAHVIALTPALSVLVGGLMEASGLRPTVFSVLRIEGANGNAEPFALLAFVGFVVALHETTRPRRPLMPVLAVVNLTCVVLSGTRMAIFASCLFLLIYALVSSDFRTLVIRHRNRALLAGAIVLGVFVWYWPTLELRLFYDDALDFAWTADPARDLDLSNRDDVWRFYVEEWQLSPWFGRGIGSGQIAAGDWLALLQIRPHNQYLHLLVTTGVVGFLLIASAIFLWYRQLLESASDRDRRFLLVVCPPVAALAVTEDVLLFSTALGLFAYFGALLTKPATARRDEGSAKSSSRSRRTTLEPARLNADTSSR